MLPSAPLLHCSLSLSGPFLCHSLSISRFLSALFFLLSQTLRGLEQAGVNAAQHGVGARHYLGQRAKRGPHHFDRVFHFLEIVSVGVFEFEGPLDDLYAKAVQLRSVAQPPERTGHAALFFHSCHRLRLGLCLRLR